MSKPIAPVRGRRQAVQALWMIAVSYGIDAVLLYGYVALGAAPASAHFWYLTAGFAHLLIFGTALRTGLSSRLGDHSLTIAQTLFVACVELWFLWAAPGAALLFVAVLFVTFTFGTFSLNFRQSAVVVGVITLGMAAVMASGTAFGRLVEPTTAGKWLGSTVLVISLARCLVLGIWATSLRARLDRKNLDLAHALNELDRLATTDHLTGIMNRRSLMDAIELLSANRSAGAATICVAMLDLDHFKTINDRHGHLVGDAVLKQFAQVVKSQLRDSDAVGRYGGEEFLIVLKNTPASEAAPALDRIRVAVASYDWAQLAPGLRITVSIGAAHQRLGDSLDVLLGRADAALYDAKRAGRDQVAFADR